MPKEERLKLGNRSVEVSNLAKVLYPATRFSKAGIIHYYLRIAPWLLPNFRDPGDAEKVSRRSSSPCAMTKIPPKLPASRLEARLKES